MTENEKNGKRAWPIHLFHFVQYYVNGRFSVFFIQDIIFLVEYKLG